MKPKLREVVGHSVILRLVESSDAEYIWNLRTDARYNTHLSAVHGTAEDQKLWIERYKDKELAGSEYYFVVLRKDNLSRCGTVRIYNITDKCFTWGSWILDETKPAKAALDSALQVYNFAFDHLQLSKSVFDVRKQNERTLAFHDRFGAKRTGETPEDVLFEVPVELYREIKQRYTGYFR